MMNEGEKEMIIQTKEFIKDLDGGDTELTIGKALGNIILATKGDPLRSYLLAQNLVKGDVFNLPKSDLEFIKSAIKDNGQSVYGSALVAGQLLYMLSKFQP